MPEEKDSIMKLLLSSSNSIPNKMEPWKKDGGRFGHQRDSEFSPTSKLSSYLQRLSGQIDGSVNAVDLDHNYSRPWNWRPENSYTKPVRTLFISRIPNAVARASGESIEPEGEGGKSPVPPYDSDKARILLDQTERHLKSVRSEQPDPDWQSTIDKSDWGDAKRNLLERVLRIIDWEMLGRLSVTGGWNEPALRRVTVKKSARRLRTALANVSWQPRLVQWLHGILMENLDSRYLVAYIDILQLLRSKVPTLVERMVSNASPNGKWNVDMLDVILQQRPCDPAAFAFSCYNPHHLPGNPLLVIVPNGVHVGGKQSCRLHRWQSYFSQLGSPVVLVNTPHNFAQQNKVGVITSLEQMLIATRSKISELRSDYSNKKIILVGLNTGSALACQVALVEHVTAVVCLGFALNTVEDKRGQPDDSILNINVPVLFVIGQNAKTASVDDMEELRERVHAETGLVVVGGGDDQLRITKGKQRADGITQSMVDRCIVDEVGDFIGTVLSNPYSGNRGGGGGGGSDIRPRYKMMEKKRKSCLQDEIGAKKQHAATATTMQSQDGGTPVVIGGGGAVRKPRMTIPRSGCPPSSRTKWTAQVHRPFETKQRNSYSQVAMGSMASITRTASITEKSQSTRPSIDNISIVNSIANVLGGDESASVASLVDELTPDSLLDMPVIIAQDDANNHHHQHHHQHHTQHHTHQHHHTQPQQINMHR